MNIYLAGKVKNKLTNNRFGGWRHSLIYELFGVNISGIGLNASEDSPDDYKIIDINNKFSYVGPFLYGCDHKCSHINDYAHGVLNCTSENYGIYENIPNFNVLKNSLNQIKMADIVIVNFNENSLESYGTMGEIGYAFANNKKIFGLGEHIPELWFLQGMCEMCENIEKLQIKIFEHVKNY